MGALLNAVGGGGPGFGEPGLQTGDRQDWFVGMLIDGFVGLQASLRATQ